MLEIFGLLIAVGAIGTLARGKKKSPALAISSAVAGWLIIRVAGLLAVASSEEGIYFMLSAWVWIALVAGYLQ